MKVNDIQLSPTNVEHCFRFPTPPEGFQCHKASDDDLRKFGLPHRPDPKKHPAGARAWLHAMGKIKKFVSPNLIVGSNIVHGVPKKIVKRRPHIEGKDTLIDTPSFGNWSGLISSNFPPYSQVWANWVVPAVDVPPGGKGDYYCSLWIGLFDPDPNPNPDPLNVVLFQAGTQQAASSGGDQGYHAWIEWFPGVPVTLDGSGNGQSFPLKPGQAIAVSLDSAGNGGVVSMLNLSTGVAITPIFISPPTINYNNVPIPPPNFPTKEAVWIMERPAAAISKDNIVTYAALADYGEAIMTLAGAVGTNVAGGGGKGNQIAVGENDQGELVYMLADDGVTIISIAAEAPGLTFTFLD